MGDVRFLEEVTKGALVEGVSNGEIAFGGIDEKGTEGTSMCIGRVGCGAESEEGLSAAIADDVMRFFEGGVARWGWLGRRVSTVYIHV